MNILVTAGPTREFLDPVRFLSNRSSGKMGFAVAQRALDRGHHVVLVAGPTALADPAGARVLHVTTAAEMLAAVESALSPCDALVMAAAVADYRPRAVAATKLKKRADRLGLELEPTPDILTSIQPRKGDRVFVGFAAETDRVLEEARRKRTRKGLDLIVANDVTVPGAGFDVDTNQVTLLADDGTATALPLMPKTEVADRILDWVEARLAAGPRAPAATARRARSPGELAAGLSERLGPQMIFVREVDRLKSIYRRTLLTDGSRFENDAEHSWHLAVMALVLQEHANEPGLDWLKVLKMVLLHDIVEIDAGDTYCYDEAGQRDKPARERAAAARIFGLLPSDQAQAFRGLWEEFEARQTPEACYAAALDRLQPLLHNYCTGGRAWRQHGVDAGRVEEANRHIGAESATLWRYAERLIRAAVDREFLEAGQKRGQE